MNISPEEKAEAIRNLKSALRECADTKWEFVEYASKGLELKVTDEENPIASISLPCGEGLIYETKGKVYQISPTRLAKFFQDLEENIRLVEGEILQKSILELAASSIGTLIHREEFEGKGVDPSRYFKTQFDRVVKAYNELRQELSGFPIGIFVSYDFDVPKEILKTSKDQFEKLAGKKQGKKLVIKNMHPFTVGFRRNDNSMFFDPIDFYYTDDERSQYFRKQLEKYAKPN